MLQKVHLINERRLAQEPEVIAFHGGEGLPDYGGSGNQNHIHRHPQHVLMQAHAFANEPAATIADDGFAEFAGGNHSETGRTPGRQFLPVQNQTALGQPVALLLEARNKLPKHTQSVWRGVKGVDLTSGFPKGKKIFWWAFNSTSKNVSTLLDPMFCGTSGTRTQFMIEAVSGIDIAHYSMVDSEAEVLLFPGTKLEVVDVADMGHGLFQVHLREVKVPVQLIK